MFGDMGSEKVTRAMFEPPKFKGLGRVLVKQGMIKLRHELLHFSILCMLSNRRRGFGGLPKGSEAKPARSEKVEVELIFEFRDEKKPHQPSPRLRLVR